MRSRATSRAAGGYRRGWPRSICGGSSGPRCGGSRGWQGRPDRARQESKPGEGSRGGEVSEKSLEMRHFQVFTYPEEPQFAFPGPPESLGMKKDERNGSNGGGWMYNRCWPGW
jgi:hypothetical protein